MAAKSPIKSPRGHKMPEQIPAGEILRDMAMGQWILGKSIGVGRFAEIYSAAPYSEKIPKNYPNVIKIEPKGNSSLFKEMHFYMRQCKPDEIIDRYGKDLWKIFEENNRQFPEHVVYKLALQIIDILEYIHHKNRVHGNIKGEKLLLDLHSYDQVYLVDFGLVSRWTSSTEFKVDPTKSHYGTLQYTSRDAHMGVPTRRGDIEILSYNIIMWLCGSLPWEKLLEPVAVQKQKEKAFNNIDSFLAKCFHGSVPQAVHKFMTLLASIKFNETPSYEKFKEILIAGIKKLNHKPDGKLKLNNISVATQQATSKYTPQKIKKPLNEIRKSPCTKHLDVLSANISMANSRKSTIGVVIDKKRCNKRDIEKALDDMDSDDEYDVQILKKTSKITRNTASSRRKKISIDLIKDDSEDDSEDDLI
ncbi:Nucleosomal histone kinase 1 [Temnothorax longispinosus]|uniref:Nucleosomal histone kinase 1 n=1 Tax=Temnothorax longispinosus TaxID=300112 RepID=A0A4S2L622_9HYME|nr:Nucleosomal histone kinase 1 [Temnothorax longispinosus]